jgi:hypothetical protein
MPEGLLEKQVENRVGGWIQTYTGGRIWPLDPRPEEINIEDMAHALSNLCRFGGHVKQFYSVAQHCILAAELLEELPTNINPMYGLLHDASEAYLIDLPRPIKYSLGMSDYRDAERRLEAMIYTKFGLGVEPPSEVKWIDRILLRNEQDWLMPKPQPEWEEDRRADVWINRAVPMSPPVAEKAYRDAFLKYCS